MISLQEAQAYLDALRALPKEQREALQHLAAMPEQEASDFLRKMRELDQFVRLQGDAGETLGRGPGRPPGKGKKTQDFQFDPPSDKKRGPGQKQQIYQALRLGPMKRVDLFVRFPTIPTQNIATHLSTLVKEHKIVMLGDHTYDGSPEVVAKHPRTRKRDLFPDGLAVRRAHFRRAEARRADT